MHFSPPNYYILLRRITNPVTVGGWFLALVNHAYDCSVRLRKCGVLPRTLSTNNIPEIDVVVPVSIPGQYISYRSTVHVVPLFPVPLSLLE